MYPNKWFRSFRDKVLSRPPVELLNSMHSHLISGGTHSLIHEQQFEIHGSHESAGGVQNIAIISAQATDYLPVWLLYNRLPWNIPTLSLARTPPTHEIGRDSAEGPDAVIATRILRACAKNVSACRPHSRAALMADCLLLVIISEATERASDRSS